MPNLQSAQVNRPELFAHQPDHWMTDMVKHAANDSISTRVKHDFDQRLTLGSIDHVCPVGLDESILEFKSVGQGGDCLRLMSPTTLAT